MEPPGVRLESRLRSLERAHGPGPGNCPICRGKGKLTVSRVQEDEPPPVPDGCEYCGEVQQIIVRGVKINQIER